MSSKGYSFESEIENFFLAFTNQNKQTSLLKFDDGGLLQINRSFRVPNSGAMQSIKGDIITAIKWLPKQFKVECKARNEHTKKDGQIVIVEKDWIKKNEDEASVDNQIPILVFSFKRMKKNRIWWILSQQDYDALYSCIKNLHLDIKATYPFLFTEHELIESKKHDKIKFTYLKLSKNDRTIWSYYDSFLKNNYYILSHKQFAGFLEELRRK